jgi:hypothetical protein
VLLAAEDIQATLMDAGQPATPADRQPQLTPLKEMREHEPTNALRTRRAEPAAIAVRCWRGVGEAPSHNSVVFEEYGLTNHLFHVIGNI